MIDSAQTRNSGRRLPLLLVAAALLLRVFVPAGWMPQVGTGRIALSWCADSGVSGPAALNQAKALLADAIGKPDPAEHPKSPDQPCAFAMAAQPLAPPALHALPLPPLPPEPILHAQLEPMPGRGLAAPPPLATGPPLLG